MRRVTAVMRATRIVLVVLIIFLAGGSFQAAWAASSHSGIGIALVKLCLAPIYLTWRT